MPTFNHKKIIHLALLTIMFCICTLAYANPTTPGILNLQLNNQSNANLILIPDTAQSCATWNFRPIIFLRHQEQLNYQGNLNHCQPIFVFTVKFKIYSGSADPLQPTTTPVIKFTCGADAGGCDFNPSNSSFTLANGEKIYFKDTGNHHPFTLLFYQ